MKNDGSFALADPDYVNSVSFSSAGSTAKDIPISSQATHLFFSADCNFAARYTSSIGSTLPAVYGGTVTGGSGCELNPGVRYIGKGRIGAVSVISPTSGVIMCAQFNSGSS